MALKPSLFRDVAWRGVCCLFAAGYHLPKQQHRRRARTSNTPRRKPEISRTHCLLHVRVVTGTMKTVHHKCVFYTVFSTTINGRFTLCGTFPLRHRSIFVPSEWSVFTLSVVRRVQSPSRTARDRRPAIISTKYVAHCHGMHFPIFVNY